MRRAPAIPRARRRALWRPGLSALAAALAGCGSSAATITSAVSVRTAAGVRYSDGVTVRGSRECSIQTYGIIAPHVNPFTHTTRSCGPSSRTVGAVLIQVARPRTAFILDRPARGCTAVRITAAGKRPIVADLSCSATKPTLRLTPLPSAAMLTIDGIAGVTRLTLRDYHCSFICSRQIGTPG